MVSITTLAPFFSKILIIFKYKEISFIRIKYLTFEILIFNLKYLLILTYHHLGQYFVLNQVNIGNHDNHQLQQLFLNIVLNFH